MAAQGVPRVPSKLARYLPFEAFTKKMHLIGEATSSEAFGFFTHLHKLVSLSRSTEVMLQLLNKLTAD